MDLIQCVARYITDNQWTYCIPDIVLIEQQPIVASYNVVVQHALCSTILALARSVGNTDLKIDFVSPRRKFSMFAAFCSWPPTKPTYKDRKLNGMYITEALLTKFGYQASSYDLNYDMCDAFANACAYIAKNK
jgi:hypothetical protein